MWKQKLTNCLLVSLWWMGKLVIRLRYRIHVKGFEEIKKQNGSSGILFLPNHPAQIDPAIITLLLWKQFHPRPLVVDYFYNLKGIGFLMKFVRALSIPSLDISANKWKLHQVEKLFKKVAKGLKEKDSYLIYPSGRLKLTAEEIVGGASFVYDLVQACPDVNIVLIRMTGLWGSSFSRAITGEVPDLKKTLLHGLKVILKNGIFFAPKRDVTVEFSKAPADFPYKASRKQFNEYLERWYNQYPAKGPEPMKLVSFSAFKKEYPKIEVVKTQKDISFDVDVPFHIKDEIYHQIGKLSQHPVEDIKPSTHLSIELGMDSLDIAQLYVFLDERYDVMGIMPGQLQTVADVLKAAVGTKEKAAKHEKGMSARLHWPTENKRGPVQIPDAKTIPEAFLKTCDRMQNHVACADLISGMLSYQRVKLAALILADKIRPLPGKNIGVLMPSSVGGYIVTLAVLLAGKVPVMLNWTAGIRSLNFSAEITKLETVLTSQKFLENLEGGDLGDIEDRLVFLEDVKGSIGFKDKLRGLFLSKLPAGRILSKLKLNTLTEEDHGVVLFTSGSEAQPKAVPLTHKNILTNQRNALAEIPLKSSDVLYGVLPPFHSFGYTVTGLFPLLAGLRVCYSPDPTDSHKLAKEIDHWKVTLFFCAPSFIRMLFQVAEKSQLKSLRLIVSGAEKTPQELFDYAKNLENKPVLIEGYGITECSPIVSLNRPDEPLVGVGRPIPGVELCVVDPDTKQPIPSDKEGEICIRGDSVFNGYLGNQADPFVMIDGKKWYHSGDLGHIDPATKSLVLSGRLKRFVKIGGEMVSLGGLEQHLLLLARDRRWYKETGTNGPSLAVSVVEKPNEKPVIILYSTFDVNKDDVNIALKESGYGRIVKVGMIKKIDEIPLTGTGKTHYRLLDEMLS